MPRISNLAWLNEKRAEDGLPPLEPLERRKRPPKPPPKEPPREFPKPAPSPQLAPRRPAPQPLVELAPSQQPAPSQQQPVGFTKLSHFVTDEVLRTLDPYSQAVLIQLLRLSWGHQKDHCRIGLPKLAERCGFSIDRARKSVRNLKARGMISEGGTDFDNPVQAMRGTIYRILLKTAPSRQQAGSQQQANKESKDLIKKDIIENEKLLSKEEIDRLLSSGG